MGLAQTVGAGVAAGAALFPPAYLAHQYEMNEVNPTQVADACWDIANGDPSVADLVQGPTLTVELPDGQEGTISLPEWCSDAVRKALEEYGDTNIVIEEVPPSDDSSEPTTTIEYGGLPEVQVISRNAQTAEDAEESNRDNAVGTRTLIAWGTELSVVGLVLAGKKIF